MAFKTSEGIFELTVECFTDMVEAPGSNRHPLGQLAYRIISGNTWYDSQTILQDQKVSSNDPVPFACLLLLPLVYMGTRLQAGSR